MPKGIAPSFCFNDENAPVLKDLLGQFIGDSTCMSARESEVVGWINRMIPLSVIIGSDGLLPMFTGFVMGYIMRGFDSLLDFRLTEEEVFLSILKTYSDNHSDVSLSAEKAIEKLFSKMFEEDGSDD